MPILCGHSVHRLKDLDGQLTAVDHDDVAERVLRALKGSDPPCIQAIAALNYPMDDPSRLAALYGPNGVGSIPPRAEIFAAISAEDAEFGVLAQKVLAQSTIADLSASTRATLTFRFSKTSPPQTGPFIPRWPESADFTHHIADALHVPSLQGVVIEIPRRCKQSLNGWILEGEAVACLFAWSDSLGNADWKCEATRDEVRVELGGPDRITAAWIPNPAGGGRSFVTDPNPSIKAGCPPLGSG